MATAEDLWWPKNLEEFGLHVPTLEQWEAELASGWAGSDGSTASLDDIEGIRIGQSGREYQPGLPANLHDYHYRVIRRLMAHHEIDEMTRTELQATADHRHYAGLLRCVSVLIHFDGWIARRRAGVRYQVLRWRGRSRTLPSAEEAYRDLQRPNPG
jgi:hypothetical protein